MKHCKECFQDLQEVTPVNYKMFDTDGTNLEELPTCSAYKEHNTWHDHYDYKQMETFTHDYLSEDETIELPLGEECDVYSKLFMDEYGLLDWYWEEVWRQVTGKDDPAYAAQNYFTEFIQHWFDCVITWESNSQGQERCNPEDYDEQFELVNSYVTTLELSEINHMALYGMLITLSFAFWKYMKEKYENVYSNITY